MVNPIAIYLPQYHPIPENDSAWGIGFTEWTNVKKALPFFNGHLQPHIPDACIGYYDLRDQMVLVKQAALAKEFGIYGFAYYHYWFNGKQLLETPLINMLKSGTPDYPFCYIWANENWTKRWDGRDNDVIIKQIYSFNDDRNHIQYLCNNVFNDNRYIKIKGKPVFIIYKPFLFPDIKTTIKLWREEISKTEFKNIYLIAMDNFLIEQNSNILGFDATIHFQPDYRIFGKRIYGSFFSKLLNKFKIKKSAYLENSIFSYEEYAKRAVEFYFRINDHKCYPGIMPGWDNSPRRKEEALIFLDSTPELYKNWLISILDKYNGFNNEENFIFINAWNEWGEGNHLEPCKRWGFEYLKATRQALKEKSL